jgi:hypothetical protein
MKDGGHVTPSVSIGKYADSRLNQTMLEVGDIEPVFDCLASLLAVRHIPVVRALRSFRISTAANGSFTPRSSQDWSAGLILSYTGWSYRVFRGKVRNGEGNDA